MSSLVETLRAVVTTGSDEKAVERIVGEARKIVGKTRLPVLESAERLAKSFAATPESAAAFAAALHKRDLSTEAGKAFKREVEELAAKDPGFRAELQKVGALGKDGEVLGNPHALSPEQRQARLTRSYTVLKYSPIFDRTGESARRVVNAAITDMDQGAQAALKKAVAGGRDILDAEELAEHCVKAANLRPDQAKAFRRAVQREACSDLGETLTELVKSLNAKNLTTDVEAKLPQLITKAMERELAHPSGPSLQRLRNELSQLTPELVSSATAKYDVALVEKFLETFVSGTEAKKVLESAFDAEGRLRLFEDVGSFRKVYTPARAARAGQNLYGWLYELSKFNKQLVVDESAKFAEALVKASKDAGVEGLKITHTTLHFNVRVPETVGSKNLKQATDHVSQVGFKYRNNEASAMAVAAEAKGIAGVAAGKEQLRKLPGRYAGKTIQTEHGALKIGKDLHIDLEGALKAADLPKDAIPKIVSQVKAAMGGKSYGRIVVYPPANAAGRGVREIEGGVLLIAHDIPRDEMEHLYASIALLFNLVPRKLPLK